MDRIPQTTSLVDLFRWRINQSPHNVAFKFLDKETTYQDFDSSANKVAQGLIAEGCKPNARVAFSGKNSDTFEFFYGNMKSRTVPVAINWRLAAPEIAFILNDSESEILFVDGEFDELIKQVENEIPKVRKIITIGNSNADWENYKAWRDRQENIDPMLASKSEDDVLQMYTSGTTGLPKGAQLTNANILNAAPMVDQTWCKDWHEGSVNLICMPVFHVAGGLYAILGAIFGCKNIIIPEVDPGLILALIESEKIELALFVPAVILFLLQHPKSEETDFTSLRQVVYGASPIAEDTLIKAIETMQCDFWQVYGLTETCGMATTMTPEYHDPAKGKLRSCGQPYPGIEIKIVDTNNNQLGTGEVGEILIKSGTVMKSYWNRSEATAETIVDDWFYSGDAGFFDEDGFLFIHDRVKDMIISGAENIYPAEVENALMSHPQILDAAVVGIPDEKWGETVMGFVILAEDASISEDEIIAYSREKIAGFKCPKTIKFINEIPRNPTGKVLRRKLREPYWKGKKRNIS
ncbi:MAG TPA: long-chain-fatty-acid--CoA ligase [Gammaproteobacteria bacterium]|nr:long-chain-fatty-acid--CoA ligase [Gammaproteobacteria bacterium]